MDIKKFAMNEIKSFKEYVMTVFTVWFSGRYYVDACAVIVSSILSIAAFIYSVCPYLL